jgi:lysophospholipase L1-like esterase
VWNRFRRSIRVVDFKQWATSFVTCGAIMIATSRPHGEAPAQASPAPQVPADRAAPRTDRNSMIAHAQLLEKARTGGIDVYFVGDSIVRRWGATDYPALLASWRRNFFGWNAADFGWGADRTENILWRLENGELDGVNPKVIVILAGTNNVGTQPGDAGKVAAITRGLTAILGVCRQKAPEATIILTAIFPRNDSMAVLPEIDRINANIARLADGRKVRYLNVNDKLADTSGRLYDGMMNERDKLHPTLQGYQRWADELKPIFTELLGPPAATDHAPPPTGDPSARPRPPESASPHRRTDIPAFARPHQEADRHQRLEHLFRRRAIDRPQSRRLVRRHQQARHFEEFGAHTILERATGHTHPSPLLA